MVQGNRRGAKGLSPRVRGNPTPPPNSPTPSWSIPACAGEPSLAGTIAMRTPVYPRVCGGTKDTTSTTPQNCGLSPRVRGNPISPSEPNPLERSIPACAGEPRNRAGTAWVAEVYPRVCGGTPLLHLAEQHIAGLSPRVRGNQGSGRLGQRRHRSIPACAGEPKCWGSRQGKEAVYPRVCGGTRPSRGLRRSSEGLSPRVRGNRPTRQSG